MRYLFLVIVLAFSTTAFAQDSTPRLTYYLAADADGVQQVYQHLLDGQSEPRQLTHAASDVLTFGRAADGLSIAYISKGQLWLQPIHTDTAEVLAPISMNEFVSSPVFSPDSHYIAYNDYGVWLLDLSTRTTRQLLADILEAEVPSDLRQYQPAQFAPNADELIVDVTLSEWKTAGVYNLTTDQWQELPGVVATDVYSLPNGLPLADILPLADGRAFVYGAVGAAGAVSLFLADNLDAAHNPDPDLLTSALADVSLFPAQAVEIEPGVVRVFGPASTLNGSALFYFDYDGENVGEVQLVALTDAHTVAGDLSPDGRIVPLYLDSTFNQSAHIEGQLSLLDITTDALLDFTFPDRVGVFHW